MRTGILGGTFDPIHIAHLHTAECALSQLRLDRVLVVPAGDPWQKADRDVTLAEHRLEMCRIALDGVDGIDADDREIGREGSTYTIDTLETFPDEEELTLIVGADAAKGLHTWHRWEDVLQRATLAVAPRPGTRTPAIEGAVEIGIGLLEISGTDIRRRAREGRPFRYLVTRAVHDYVIDHDLYAQVG